MLIALVDDNQKDIDTATELVNQCFFKKGYLISKFDTFFTTDDFLKNFKKQKYDLILLDIFIDDRTGLDVARAIREQDEEVKLAFITTSDDFAIDSYDVNASYYIKKPLTERGIEKLLSRVNAEQIEANRFILLPDGKKVIAKNILYTEYFNHNITFYLTNDDTMSTWLAHNELCELIKPFPYLIACNQGSIVNLYEVKQKDEDCFTMTNGEIVTISRRKLKEVNDAYENHIFSIIRRKDENRRGD